MKRKNLIQAAVAACFYLIWATPVFAHEATGVSSAFTLVPLIGGLLGGAGLAAVGRQMIRPQPPRLMLAGLSCAGFASLVHIAVAVLWGDNLLLLNGIGFLVLGIAWGWLSGLIPNGRTLIPAGLALYTLVTLIGYFWLHSHYDIVGLVSKAVELSLLAVIGILFFKPA